MPNPPSGPQLPERGTLLFSADINEEMLWEDAPGDSTKVLYAKEYTRTLKAPMGPTDLCFVMVASLISGFPKKT